MPVAGVDYPATFAQLTSWFPDDEACGSYLAETGAIVAVDGGISLTATGRATLDRLGVDVEDNGDGAQAIRSRPLVRACLDWSQRRHHLAGVAGSRLLAALLDRGWLRRPAERRRELRFDGRGPSRLGPLPRDRGSVTEWATDFDLTYRKVS